MRDDLQDLVDEVSRLLGAPATLEDPDFTLLAFCAQGEDASDDSGPGTALDAVRTRSILTRGSPAATRRWFSDFGIAGATAPLRTPADPTAGILTRLCLPVRHRGR
ncbi:MAG: Transcriptional regulator, PucR family, partial [Klenkia sp.]|nr:Transcriptional regulator, PucR family [Klenkia sp.]